VSRFSSTASAILVALVVAACSGSTPSAQGSNSSEPASVAASESAAAEQSQGSEPSYAPGAGNLEGIVPTEVGGLTMDWTYASGQDVLGSEGMTPEVQDFLDAAHADLSDITTAIGFAYDQASGAVISIFALQVAGAGEGALRDEFRSVMEADETNVLSDANVGGKSVLAVSNDDGTTTYLYVKDDVVFLVGGSSQELAADALSQLP
jgi:hypothetical protein